MPCTVPAPMERVAQPLGFKGTALLNEDSNCKLISAGRMCIRISFGMKTNEFVVALGTT